MSMHLDEIQENLADLGITMTYRWNSTMTLHRSRQWLKIPRPRPRHVWMRGPTSPHSTKQSKCKACEHHSPMTLDEQINSSTPRFYIQ